MVNMSAMSSVIERSVAGHWEKIARVYVENRKLEEQLHVCRTLDENQHVYLPRVGVGVVTLGRKSS
jgi:hypothetical protein